MMAYRIIGQKVICLNLLRLNQTLSMKYYLSLFLILLSLNALAQKVKKVTVENKEEKTKEIYEVLKSDTSIRQGVYKRYFGNKLITDGQYNKKKDSLWVEYGYAGKISVRGFYKEGKRYGIWEYYNWKDSLIDKYDMTTNTRIYHKATIATDTLKYGVIADKDTTYTLLDRPPVYAPGELRLSLTLWALKYPRAALENNIMGQVVIAIIVDENGHVLNYRIKKNIKDGLGEEALRVAKMLDDDWLPAVVNGKPIRVEYPLRVNFSLTEK